MKFVGKIGFWIEDTEIKPGIFKSSIVEKPYICEVSKNYRNFQASPDQQNDNLILSNTISIIANIYFKENWQSIKYVLWNGVKWKVSSIDISIYPRVEIKLGGVYNE